MEKLYRIFAKINRLIQTGEMIVGVLCLFTLVVVMLLNACGRYLLKMPILWADELNNFLFVWMSFLACAYIMGDDGHIRVTAIIDLLPPKGRLLLAQAVNLITLMMFLLFISPAIKLLDSVTFSGLMRLPLKYIYAVIPLSFGLMCFHILHNTVKGLWELAQLNTAAKGGNR